MKALGFKCHDFIIPANLYADFNTLQHSFFGCFEKKAYLCTHF